MKRFLPKLFVVICFLSLAPLMMAQNVGIGTPTPDYLLDVAGSVGIDDFIYHNEDTNGDAFFGFPEDDVWQVLVAAQQALKVDGNQNRVVVGNPLNGTDFQVIGDAFDHLLYVDSQNDKIGVGKSNPSYLLDIGGDVRIIGDAYDHLFYIDTQNDRIGVNKANPDYLLDIGGDVRIIGDAFDHLVFVDSQDDKVGIGKSNPDYLFDINGDLRVIGDAFDHLLYVDTQNDRVGIGTDQPQFTLDVNGVISGQKLRLGSAPVIAAFQSGEINLGVFDNNSPPQGVIFDQPFDSNPILILTFRNTGMNPDARVFATINSINPFGATFNLYRADSDDPVIGGQVYWMAIEQ
ncbi:MAG: hypothetical protein AAF598_03980 [Bacteroidota bacterium]